MNRVFRPMLPICHLQVVHLRHGPEGRPGDQLLGVLLGEHLSQQRQGGAAQPPVTQRPGQPGEAAQHPHGVDAPAGRPLPEVQDLQASGPQGPVTQLEPGPSAVELIEVEEELDLHVSLLAGQLAEPPGQGPGIGKKGSAST